MKTIISDYFKTIDRYGKKRNILENIFFNQDIKSINEFIANGNKFIVYTNEPFLEIQDELKRNKMNYSYLSSYNGLITMDNKNNIVLANYLSQYVIEYIRQYFKKNYYDIELIQCYNETGSKIISDKTNFLMIGLDFYNDEKAGDFIDEIKFIFKELEIKMIGKTVCIKNFINKEKGVDNLTEKIEELKIMRDNIFILGNDDLYDYTLIIKYNGFVFRGSYISQMLESDKQVSSVKSLIKKIK